MGEKITLPKLKTYAQCGIVILTLKIIISYSVFAGMIPYLDSFLSFLVIVFFSLSILNNRYKMSTIFVYAAVSLLGLYSSYLTGNTMFFITILTILAIYREKNIVLILFKYEVVFFVIIVVLALITGKIRMFEEDGFCLYLNLGFSHPNVAAAILFNIMIMWIWLSYNKLKGSAFLLIGIFPFAVYFITGSRTIIVAGLVTVLLVLLSKSESSLVQSGLAIAAGLIVPLLALFFMYAILNYRSGVDFIRTIDELLTGRIKLGAYAYEHFDFTLFGQKVIQGRVFGYDALWQMSMFTTFDNIYTKLMVNNGIIWLVIISVAFIRVASFKNNIINSMIIAWAVYGITEGHGIYPCMCFPILLIALSIDKNKDLKRINEF